MDVIADVDNLHHLYFLLEFLAAWEKRPPCLTPMAYKWCSALSEMAELGPELRPLPRFKLQAMASDNRLSGIAEWLFSSAPPGDTSNHTHEHPQWTEFYPRMLPVILEIGFRLVTPGRNQQAPRLDHTPHHDLVFKSAFSFDDDEVVADGVCAWIADSNHMPAGSCVHHLTKRMEKGTHFSPRLRQMGICLIERMWRNGLWVSDLETVYLLNCLNIGVDDIEYNHEWAGLLVDVICSPAGFDGLSIHYWDLLEGLPPPWVFPTTRAMEMARSLEETEDLEKLGVWMVIAWQSDEFSGSAGMEDLGPLKQVTLKYLLRRPLAIPRFERLLWSGGLRPDMRIALKDICTEVRTEQLPLEPPPL